MQYSLSVQDPALYQKRHFCTAITHTEAPLCYRTNSSSRNAQEGTLVQLQVAPSHQCYWAPAVTLCLHRNSSLQIYLRLSSPWSHIVIAYPAQRVMQAAVAAVARIRRQLALRSRSLQCDGKMPCCVLVELSPGWRAARCADQLERR